MAYLLLTVYAHILDLGCGDGKITALLVQQVKQGSVLGIDNSSAMIALAKATYADYPRLSFQCMDALNLNVDQTFNLIFSNATLHWITDHKTLIKQCYKALSVNGKLYLKMGGKGDVAGIIDAMDVVKSSSRWQSYLSEFRFPYIFLDIEDYEVILNDAGFRIDKLDIVSKDALHQGQSGLTCWLRTTWLPYMSRIPINGQTAFIDEVTAYYLT